MSRKSKSSRSSDPTRPFEPAIWAKAEAVARRYQMLTWYDEEEKAYFGRCIELPECMSHGETPAERDAMVIEATALAVGTMLEAGQRPPLPARDQARTEQVNVRLSRAEKRLIEDAARSEGFRGIADYLRVKVLSLA
jgi:predicted RNase H-like HicB family nuclease